MILPSSYLGPQIYYALIQSCDHYLIESHEHFVKQSYRSRCEIYGANGKLSLSIPLKKWNNHSPIRDVKIAYEENWQTLHWRSICSAYRRSPYFEFYEDHFEQLFQTKMKYLMDWNHACDELIHHLLKWKREAKVTDTYKNQQPDYRTLIHPKKKEIYNAFHFHDYWQTFQEKCGFIPNLSIIDLLFNLGPESTDYLNSITLIDDGKKN